MSVTLAAFPLVYMLAVNTSSFAHLDAALTLAWGFHVPLEATTAVTHDEVVRLAALLEWLPFAAAGAALLALRRTRKVTIVAFAVLALTVTAVDLFKLSMGYNTAVTFARILTRRVRRSNISAGADTTASSPSIPVASPLSIAAPFPRPVYALRHVHR